MADTLPSMYGFLKEILSGFISKVIVAAIILLMGFILGRIIGKIVQKVLHEMEVDKIIKKAAHIKISIEEILSHITTYFIYFIAIIMALKHIGLATDVLNIVSWAIMIVIIISFFLGIKDFIPNVMAGFTIHRKNFIEEGDFIKIKNMEGKVIHINLIETKIQTKKKDIIHIPNSILTKNEVIKLNKK